jgi:hypothetical protein
MARTKASKTDNQVDPKNKKTFIEMRDQWVILNTRANSSAAKRRQYEKEIVEAGFSKQQIKISVLLQTPEGEAEFKAEMANRMLAAAYSDAAIGDQLSLFLEPDRVPATDRAAKEGQSAAMRNEAHSPPYDASVPQYKAWSDAFYAEQERQVKEGIGKLEAKDAKSGKKAKKSTAKVSKPAGKRGRPAKKATEAPAEANGTRLITKAEKQAAIEKIARRSVGADAGPPRRPAAQPVTRATLAAQKAQAREDADSYFSKTEPKGNA